MDQPGRYVYIRDMESGSSGARPGNPRPGEAVVLRMPHGAGYTCIASTHNGITATCFASFRPAQGRGLPCELWVLNIKNTGKKPRKLRTFSYVDSASATRSATSSTRLVQHILRQSSRTGLSPRDALRADYQFFGSSVKTGWL